ncbi:hypothetical protein IIC65_04005, partial [Candidatus Sumerlaeota bacterium]|nr:hypothetical protein [Candidatus Sumerlaeota bacterium]
MTTIDPRNRVAMENDGSRVDARAKVTGAAKYAADIKLPNMIHATHLRSPFAEGKLESIDLAAARKIKGVLDVALYTTDYTSRTFTEKAGEARPGRYSGESIGHVCAENPRILDDAIAALKMEWSHGEPRTNFRRELGRAGQFPAELSDGDQ